jgi:hypothetical protein
VLVDDLEHAPWLEMLEPGPAQISYHSPRLSAASGVAPIETLWKNAPLDWCAKRIGLALFQLVHLIKALDEDQKVICSDHL